MTVPTKIKKSRGRKGAGNISKVELERRQAADVEKKIADQIFKFIDEDDDFVKNLPDATRAQFITSRLHKPPPTDQELEASYLSLTAGLDHLPNVEDISKENYILRTEIFKLNTIIDAKDKKIKTIAKFSNRKATIKAFTELLKEVQHNAELYFAQRRVKLITDEEVKIAVEKAMNRKK